MIFIPVAIYDYQSGDFLGFGIKNDQSDKLQTTNIWKEGEEEGLNVQLSALNQRTTLNQHWPHPQDPDVQALVNDPSFHPIEYEERDVVDEDNSQFVYKKIARTGVEADQLGAAWIDSDDVDEEASTIVTKKAMVPKRPTDVMLRIKKACEQVAGARAGLL